MTVETLTWEHLREIPASELREGDRCYKPAAMEFYSANAETGEVRGSLYMLGKVFEIVSIVKDGETTIRNPETGDVWTETPPSEQTRVLRIVCAKCKRVNRSWPLDRGVKCSPADWATCIRQIGVAS